MINSALADLFLKAFQRAQHLTKANKQGLNQVVA